MANGSAVSAELTPHAQGLLESGRPLRVLFLAFYFPPLGGAGVQRTVKFAKYLPEFGFEPSVLTGPGDRPMRYAPLDASLRAEGPPDARIFRVPGKLPGIARTDRLRRQLGVPSQFARAWVSACESTAFRAAPQVAPHVILASMSPFETSEAAARIAASLRLPWVADLRDPWALDEVSVYPTRWHRTIELRRMRRCLSSAALIIMNTPEAANALCVAFPELAGRTITITNGFDPDDFRGDADLRRDDLFRIVHTGGLHTSLGTATHRRRLLRRWIGGDRVPIDMLTRSHVYLLRALERWRREHPAEVARSELVLAGKLSVVDREVIEASSVSDLVRTPGYLAHRESVALLRTADLLFLPLHALPRGERARVVPGKTYEYLAANRPILAAVPEGDARDLVLASHLGHVCEPDDVDGMVAALRRCFDGKRAGREPAPAPPSFYRQFERRELTARLARALRTVIEAAT